MYGYMRERAQKLQGTVFAIGGLEDHVHMVAAIPPKLPVSVFVGQVKSGSSARFNRRQDFERRFTWRESYGAISFDRQRLAHVIDYVARQPEHHADGTTIPVLEAIQGGASHFIREPESNYYIDSETWRREMMALDTAIFPD